MKSWTRKDTWHALVVLTVGTLLVAALAFLLPRDPDRIAAAAAAEFVDDSSPSLKQALKERGVLTAVPAGEALCAAPRPSIEAGPCGDRLAQNIDAMCRWSDTGVPLTVRCSHDGEQIELVLRASEEPDERWTRPLPTATSLLPPLVAIVLAIAFRRILVALLVAVWLGTSIILGADQGSSNVFVAAYTAVRDYVVPGIVDNWMMFAFTVSLMGMVNVMIRSGGVQALVEIFSRRARGTRSTQLVTAAMGTVVFFDDYANTIVVGASARPLTDAKRISREKLAYLVDSTAAPIAGVAVISTWIGIELQLLGEQLAYVPEASSAYDLFFRIVPYRFYCFLTIAFVYLVVLTRRDFGPMLKAERRARRTGAVLREGAVPLVAAGVTRVEPKPGAPPRLVNALLPIATVLGAAVTGFLLAGRGPMEEAGLAFDLLSFPTWRAAFVHGGDFSPQVLASSGATGSLVAILLATGQRILSPGEALLTWLQGVWAMRLALGILAMAMAIRAVTDDLDTAAFLVSLLQDVPALWLPVLSFLVAAAVAFSTGTSWGTMGILLPVVVPLVFHHAGGGEAAGPVLLLAIASVMDGAIFGDHCSPISDTTVLSSVASAADHMDHVRTQAPYAALTMTAAALFGYVLIAWTGWSVLVAYPLGFAALAAVLLLVGRRSE